MENKDDAVELLDLMIEEASKDTLVSTISIGLVKTLKRVRARLKPESKSS